MKPTTTLMLSLMAATSLFALSAGAHEFRFSTEGSEPFYQSSLPLAVYQFTQEDDLQDIAIFNRAGEQVPYALVPYEELHPQIRVDEETQPLPVYFIRESRLESPEGLRLEMEKSPGRTTLNVLSGESNKPERNVLLADAGHKHPPLEQMTITWNGPDNQWITLQVLVSDNLKTWSTAGHAVLLKTFQNGHALVQDRIILDRPIEARYVQLRPASDQEARGFQLTGVTAVYRNEQAIAPPLLWQDISLVQRDEKETRGEVTLDFEALGHYPASHMQIKLPQENTITSVVVLVRNRTDAPWASIAKGRVYRLVQNGQSIQNPDLTIPPTVARYWRLQFNQSGGGIGAQNPGLTLGWVAPVVVWNARGQPPYTLHVGQGHRNVNRVPIYRLLPEYVPEKARMLPPAELSPAAAQAKPGSTWVRPVDYKRWMLWGGLFLGVLLLGWMAVSLLKSQPRR